MKYKREETFRYEFGTPVNCHYRVIKIQEELKQSNKAEGKILDISLSGMKLETNLDFPLNTHQIEIEITFTLENEITLTGLLIWRKQNPNQNFSYGIELRENEEIQQILLNELKQYSKIKAEHKKKA